MSVLLVLCELQRNRSGYTRRRKVCGLTEAAVLEHRTALLEKRQYNTRGGKMRGIELPRQPKTISSAMMSTLRIISGTIGH